MRKFIKRTRQRERGDTIVEVLIAISVIGAVLGSTMLIINRNIKYNMSSQERTQAVRLAEQQVELMRASRKSPASLPSAKFCMKPGTPITTATGASGCRFDSAGQPYNSVTAASIPYTILLSKASSTDLTRYSSGSQVIHVEVSWESATSSSNETFDYYVGVF